MGRIRSARELGATLRGRREGLGLSQAAVADAAGVSRQWLSEVEAGKPTAEIGLVLNVLDVLALDLTPEPREAAAPTPGAIDAVDLDALLEEYRRP